MCYRVLIVDDHPEVCQAVARMLVRDCEVYTSTSYDDALAILDRERIQVALVDLRTPPGTIGGLSLLRAIRRRHEGVVRILFSGGNAGPELLDALNSGDVWRFVEKPTSNVEPLRKLVKEAGQRSKRIDFGLVLEQIRADGEERGKEMSSRMDRTDARLDRIAKNVELLSGQVRAHGTTIAGVQGDVDEMRSTPGIQVDADAMMALRASVGDHEEKFGTLAAQAAKTDEAVRTVMHRLDELQGVVSDKPSKRPATLATLQKDGRVTQVAIGMASLGTVLYTLLKVLGVIK